MRRYAGCSSLSLDNSSGTTRDTFKSASRRDRSHEWICDVVQSGLLIRLPRICAEVRDRLSSISEIPRPCRALSARAAAAMPRSGPLAVSCLQHVAQNDMPSLIVRRAASLRDERQCKRDTEARMPVRPNPFKQYRLPPTHSHCCG